MKLVEPRIAAVVLFWEVLKLDQSTLVQRVECSAHILWAAGRVAAESHGKLAGAHQWIAASTLEQVEDLALLCAQAATHQTLRLGVPGGGLPASGP